MKTNSNPVEANSDIVVLFSGGTDSTLAAALCAEKFRKVRLVTYSRMGIASVENSRINAESLMEKFGKEKISHEIINVDELFKHISYENFLKNLFKHGFMNLSTCGLCKLSMHVRTVKYCVDNEVKFVCDGANSGMTMFPDQMKPVIEKLQEMYKLFGIRYENPVFDFDPPEEKGFIDHEYTQILANKIKQDSDFDKRDAKEEAKESKITAGQLLYQMKLAPAPNVKGSEYDRKRQPRCFQFILFSIFANKYFLNDRSYEDYQRSTLSFFSEKIETVTKLLQDASPRNRKIFGKTDGSS